MTHRRSRLPGFVPLATLPLPRGAPAAMRDARRLARVRTALGPRVGPQLVAAAFEGERIVLTLAGPGWERTPEHLLSALARQIAAALGRERVQLELRSGPERPVNNPPQGGDSFVDSPGAPADTATRLGRVAERLLARRDRSS